MQTSLNPAPLEMTPQPCPACSGRKALPGARPCAQCRGAGRPAEPRRFCLAELVSAPAQAAERWLRWMSLLDHS